MTELRGKELVMRLMMHPDPDVQVGPVGCRGARWECLGADLLMQGVLGCLPARSMAQ